MCAALYAARETLGAVFARLPLVARIIGEKAVREGSWAFLFACWVAFVRSAQGSRMCEAMHCFFPLDEMIAVSVERLTGGMHPRAKGILLSPADATAVAMDQALRGAGGGVKSAAVQPLDAVQDGALSSMVRVVLTYGGGGGGGGSGGGDAPASVVVKCVPEDLPTRMSVNAKAMFEREIAFYRTVAPALRGKLSAPRLFDARQNVGNGRCAHLVLEDLAARPGAEFHAPFKEDADLGVRPEAVHDLLRQLAAMHAQYWRSPDFGVGGALHWAAEHAKFGASLPTRQEHFLYHLGWPKFMRHFAATTPDALRKLGDELYTRLPDLYEHVFNRGPLTLIHGDVGVYNVMFHDGGGGGGSGLAETPRGKALADEGGARACIFDWQTCARGRGVYDVAFFLSFSVPASVRRAHEERFLRLYHEGLVAGGVSATEYPFEQLRQDYAVSLVVAFTTLVFSMGFLPSQYVHPIEIGAKRAIAAIEENDAVAIARSVLFPS